MGIRDWKSWLKRDDPREEACEELCRALPGARVAAEDFSLVDVPIEGGTLRVFLPQRFPHDAPTLQLLQPTRHEYVDRYNQVKAPVLEAWDAKAEIVDVVQDVVLALQPRPPLLERPPSDRSIQAPAVPDAIEAIDALATQDLRRLDEDGVHAIVEALPQVAVMSQMLADLRSTNLDSAERVRAAREAASGTDAEAQALRMRLADDVASYETLLARARALEPADPLGEASEAYAVRARAADQQSTAAVERWQSGQCDRPAFLASYVDARAEHHKARVLAALADRRRRRPPLPPRSRSYG
jgi:hypothetical protein